MTITELQPGEIFVFGSNATGSHGAGAARTAYEKFGAVWGQGHGLQGQSYGIDTMSGIETIQREVGEFLEFAGAHPELRFLVTKIGCGIAGYTPAQIAPLFRSVPENVVLPEEFTA
ncbi:A1S_2505 family phage non-structural protein [Parafrigoribacterium soli]|uniref:A1S_2505 family phage non-structural protein n=1 Tax=Parafrigoribacterium soli TaxID=3144663 RepID=UPI0032EB80E3